METTRLSPHPIRMAANKKKENKIVSVGEDVKKQEHLCTAGGNVN